MNDSASLVETVDRFCQYVTALPKIAYESQVWGPKEVLAHLVYHHELYVNLVEAFLAGTPVASPKGRFRDLNAEAVAASRETTVDKLADRLKMANQQLVKFYQQHDPNTIVVEIKAGAKLRTLAELFPEVEAHIRNHLEKLRKGLTASA